MRLPIVIAASALLAGCAWNPVLSPHAVGVADQAVDSEVATVWGVREGAKLHFTHVDGQALPSRGGGGYPVSLRLSPGPHTLRVFFATADHRWMEQSFPVNVRAGHTYVVEHRLIPGASAVVLALSDRGTTETCRYELADPLRGTILLRCSAR